MKEFFEDVATLFVVLFILLTSKEERRQLDYDNGELEDIY